MGIQSIRLAILILIISGTWVCVFASSEPSFESDRGNREPAVIGPAVVDEESSALENNIDNENPTNYESDDTTINTTTLNTESYK